MSIEKEIVNEWIQFKKQEKYPNIMLVGISGAGKSSLINYIFNFNKAAINSTRPQTRAFTVYEGKTYNQNVNLIDAAGYEMSDAKTFVSTIENFINEGIFISSDGIKEKVHIVWYCIPVSNERIEDFDVDILKELIKIKALRNRICIVFTKCDQDDSDSSKAKAFKDIINKETNTTFPFFETTTNIECTEKLDIDSLIDWSAEALDDDDLKTMFISSQMLNLDKKEEVANKCILKYSACATTTVISPIPGSDSVLLVPIQAKMIYTILDIYGVQNVVNIPYTILLELIVTELGKKIVNLILSFIPGLKIINALVAEEITRNLGNAVSKLCRYNIEKALNGENVDWANMITIENIKKFS